MMRFLGAGRCRCKAWHSLGHLPHLVSRERRHGPFGLADAIPADSGGCLQHRTEARGGTKEQFPGRPAPRRCRRRCGGGSPGGRLLEKADGHRLGNYRLRATVPSPSPGSRLEVEAMLRTGHERGAYLEAWETAARPGCALQVRPGARGDAQRRHQRLPGIPGVLPQCGRYGALCRDETGQTFTSVLGPLVLETVALLPLRRDVS